MQIITTCIVIVRISLGCIAIYCTIKLNVVQVTPAMPITPTPKQDCIARTCCSTCITSLNKWLTGGCLASFLPVELLCPGFQCSHYHHQYSSESYIYFPCSERSCVWTFWFLFWLSWLKLTKHKTWITVAKIECKRQSYDPNSY